MSEVNRTRRVVGNEVSFSVSAGSQVGGLAYFTDQEIAHRMVLIDTKNNKVWMRRDVVEYLKIDGYCDVVDVTRFPMNGRYSGNWYVVTVGAMEQLLRRATRTDCRNKIEEAVRQRCEDAYCWLESLIDWSQAPTQRETIVRIMSTPVEKVYQMVPTDALIKTLPTLAEWELKDEADSNFAWEMGR